MNWLSQASKFFPDVSIRRRAQTLGYRAMKARKAWLFQHAGGNNDFGLVVPCSAVVVLFVSWHAPVHTS